jgi:ParB family chromosome partitioning protein
MARQALGRGLNALIADKQPAADEELIEIDIDLISPNRAQPRTIFDDARLEELAQSIRENGIVQPILVRRQAGGFELVAGERRWRAAQRAGLQRITAVVRAIPDENLLELALIENIQRQELNPIEEARAYKSLTDSMGYTQEQLSKRVGRARPHIANIMRLLKLPLEIQLLVEMGKLSMGTARALLTITQLDDQRILAEEIIAKELSVRAAEKRIQRFLQERRRPQVIQPDRHDANYRAVEAKLRRRFGTKVRIIPNAKGEGGVFEIEYYSDSDLMRIYDLLKPKEEIGGNASN